VAEGFIGVAACIGLSEGVVAAWRASLEADQLATMSAGANFDVDLTRPEVRARERMALMRAGDRLVRTERASSNHRDALVLFERLGVLAVEHGLEVRRLDEAGDSSTSSDGAARRSVTLSVSGPYDRIVRLLGALGNDDQLTRISHLSIMPDHNQREPVAIAEVRLECFTLPTAEVREGVRAALAALDALEDME